MDSMQPQQGSNAASMVTPPDHTIVLQAIKTLYHDPVSSNKEAASAWLQQLQASIFAWKISDELLAAKSDLESCYFAAQTLRTKIQNSFHEVPLESHCSLRISILNHLSLIHESVIQTQLGLAITYLAILTHHDQDQADQSDSCWADPIADLLSYFSSASQSTSPSLPPSTLIDILTFMPEEVDQRSSHSSLRGIGDNRRRSFTRYLKSKSQIIISLLIQVCSPQIMNNNSSSSSSSHLPDSKLTAKVFRCLGSWVPILVLDSQNSKSSSKSSSNSTDSLMAQIEPLVNVMFMFLNDPNTVDEIHDSAADTICSLALICESYESHVALSHFLVTRIAGLEAMIVHAMTNDDCDKLINYSRILTEMSESIVESLLGHAIVSTSDQSLVDQESRTTFSSVLKLVELLLILIDYYDYEVAEITFHFWYRFSELVTKSGHQDSSNSLLSQFFGHCGHKLIRGITKHVQLESDQVGLVSPDSDIYDFRLRVRDLVKEIIFTIGAQQYVQLNSILVTTNNKLTQLVLSNSSDGWEEVEAELFILSCLAGDLAKEQPNNQELVSSLINLVLSTAFKSKDDSVTSGQVTSSGDNLTSLANVTPLPGQIMATGCSILADLSPFLDANPVFLDSVLNHLLTIITHSRQWDVKLSSGHDTLTSCHVGQDDKPTLSCSAASALQPIITSSSHLTGNWKLIQILIQICCNLDQIANESTAHHLLAATSNLISSSSTTNSTSSEELIALKTNQEKMVIQLIAPNVISLKRDLEHQSQSSTSDPVIYLDRIAAIFRSLKLVQTSNQGQDSQSSCPDSELSSFITRDVWPLIESILVINVSNRAHRVIERSCRTLRFVIRTVRPWWLLQLVATTIVNLYQSDPSHSSFLYLASILVDEFATSTSDHQSSSSSSSSSSSEVLITGLINMLNAFCLTTFTFLTSSSSSSSSSSSQTVHLRNHPDTIDDFFRLCTRFLQKQPDRFLRESMLESILNLTMAAIKLDHREANTSVTKFLIELIYMSSSSSSSSSNSSSCSASSSSEVLSQILINQSFGSRLIGCVIECALFDLPSYFIPEMSDILWQLISWNRQAVCSWMESVLKSLPSKSTTTGVIPGGGGATQEQLQEFYDSLSKASHPKTVAQALRTLSRLYR